MGFLGSFVRGLRKALCLVPPSGRHRNMYIPMPGSLRLRTQQIQQPRGYATQRPPQQQQQQQWHPFQKPPNLLIRGHVLAHRNCGTTMDFSPKD